MLSRSSALLACLVGITSSLEASEPPLSKHVKCMSKLGICLHEQSHDRMAGSRSSHTLETLEKQQQQQQQHQRVTPVPQHLADGQLAPILLLLDAPAEERNG